MAGRKPIHKNKPCQQCGQVFRPVRDSSKYCSRQCQWASMRGPGHGPYLCQGCGVEYYTRRSRDGEKYCSRECAFEHKRALPFCRVSFPECEGCGRRFVARGGAKVCSDECSKQRARDRSRARAETIHPPHERTCKECGRSFVPAYGDKRRTFCCEKCARKYGNRQADRGTHRKRARKAGVAYEYVNPRRVFKRDGWRCQICGKQTPELRRGTRYSNAPELDHRVPISLGGEHTYRNVQCACRACNNQKQNKACTGQYQLWDKAA